MKGDDQILRVKYLLTKHNEVNRNRHSGPPRRLHCITGLKIQSILSELPKLDLATIAAPANACHARNPRKSIVERVSVLFSTIPFTDILQLPREIG